MKKNFYKTFLVLSVAFLFLGCKKNDLQNITEFTVTFNSNSGSEIKSLKVQENKTFSKPTNPTNGELLFANWFKEEALVNVWDFNKDVVTQNITLYAKWANDIRTITFNTNGGSDLAPMKVIKGLATPVPISPIKQGFALEGWFKEVSLTNLYDFSTIVDSDITLYAKWNVVTIETLRKLVYEATELYLSNYTGESFSKMTEKNSAAEEVLLLQDPTSEQIVTAYTELLEAMNSLVAMPHRPVAKLEIERIVDDVVYIKEDNHHYLRGLAYDITGGGPTDQRVTFTYNAEELEAWAETEVKIRYNYLEFETKSTLPAGATINITLKSAENPNIYKNIKLKVAREGEIKKMFIDVVNALPSPDKISYEDFDAITKAQNLYSIVDPEDLNSVQSVFEKLLICSDAYYNLPDRIKYSFKENVCTLTYISDGWKEEYLDEFTFVANGEFPAGKYTSNFWKYKNKYIQNRRTFKSDGTGKMENRKADDANGTNATKWKTTSIFTYTNEGSQADGGMFYIDDK